MHMTSRPLVYPFPRVLEPRSGCFRLDDTATIGLPESPAPDDLFCHPADSHGRCPQPAGSGRG